MCLTKLPVIFLALISLSGQSRDSNPLAVTTVLGSCGQYNGRTLTVRGRYFANHHGSSFGGEESSHGTAQRFATADWTRYTAERPNLDSITIDRDPRGRPSVINGMVTAVVTVKCVRNFQAHKDPESGDNFGNGEGYNGMGAATFYVIHVETVQRLPREGSHK